MVHEEWQQFDNDIPSVGRSRRVFFQDLRENLGCFKIVISTIIVTITATPIQTGERHSLKVPAHDWNDISEFNRGLELIICDHHTTALFNLWTLFGLKISFK
jgi:hypothetical protein